jgi:phage-related baseplate assembly protein
MNDLAYWTKRLQEAERELDVATRRSDVNAAARKVMLARAELRRLEQKGAATNLSSPLPVADLVEPAPCAYIPDHD